MVMSTGGTDPEITELLAELTHELRRLEREVEPEPRRLPTRHELARFTSEVAIPGLILLLQTQIRALELLRRTIRLAEGREPTTRHQSVKNRAEQLGTATLSQLDTVLNELQSAIEGRPGDDRAKRLLDDAKQLQEQIQSELEASEPTETGSVSDSTERMRQQEGELPRESTESRNQVAIDVEEELRSLKGALNDDTQLDDEESPEDSDNAETGNANTDDETPDNGKSNKDDGNSDDT